MGIVILSASLHQSQSLRVDRFETRKQAKSEEVAKREPDLTFYVDTFWSTRYMVARHFS